ncbi:MAG: hypothetical protein A2091_01080 [Desulfuromonadales bacterium GWD2_61_12]|nr:MAG: hypothetical protein A2005_04760 [Desulfuromonadales bacterium GWC2_61_20]OGR36802.1 MAG: hypothetical protein A2091_01080 [Desulfuromonadales bacterium GWD2_61_12]HAD03357.1 menaquinone biosynthesis decarboxylase [Desulfuromonas sp.]HBT83827.1 menaquinone biosynthesis decarboxylase [Desulfuromonas sp.]
MVQQVAAPAGALELRGFMQTLEAQGELQRIAATVDPHLEIAAITDRVCKGGGPALRFERVKGYSTPVLTNLFGSERRVAWALGAETLAAAADRMARALAMAGPGGGVERLRRALAAPALLSPRAMGRVSGAGGDLSLLPALQSWPGDGGRYLTLPLVFTRDPETGRGNCGMYRVQLIAGDRAAIHWRPTSDAARHHAAWTKRGEAMPVAIVLGGPPALLWAAGVPLPAGADETALAALLAGAPLPLSVCQNSDLVVPTACEAVLEGSVAPQATATEGPFGNHTGSYVPVSMAPLFRLHHLSRRADMLYPCTVVGPPPMEDCYLARATERILLPLLQVDLPEVVDVTMPLATIFHGCALVAVRDAGDGRALLAALWRSLLLKGAKLLVLVDADCDLRRPDEVFWRVINGLDPQRDMVTVAGKIGIIATGRDLGPRVAVDAATAELVARRWQEYGLGGKVF